MLSLIERKEFLVKSKLFENMQCTYKNLPSQFYSLVKPAFFSDSELVLWNHSLASTLGMDTAGDSFAEIKESFFNEGVESKELLAMAYAGHQYGHFVILGDGRAHLIGEISTSTGDVFDLQLKGSGVTPYSRRGDGRATLGPMLREYLVSEAMHALNIPSTRSLGVISTGEQVQRERVLPGAVLLRVARSHIRVGTFQYAAYLGDITNLKSLFDYTVERLYPDLKLSGLQAVDFLRSVMERQIDLVIHWMRVGFIHGVMNTDNMALSGETIDYGPCAFMDEYHPDTVFSSIDRYGRYAFANQPEITQWNLIRLAETLLPLIDSDLDKAIGIVKEIFEDYPSVYKNKWLDMMRSKLGLRDKFPEDEELIHGLLDKMQKEKADYTNTFRLLTNGEENFTFYLKGWIKSWKDRQSKDSLSQKESTQLMNSVNPVIIPRNHVVEQVLEEAQQGRWKPFNSFFDALLNPYGEPDKEQYKTPPAAHERVCKTFCGT
jgi:uncharacterized protein YdiU (UPF0061 family)